MSGVFGVERARIGWWVVAIALFTILALFVRRFVGTFVLGLFIYYGTRPLHRRLLDRYSRGAAAITTLLTIVVPVLALFGYAAFVAFGQLTTFLGRTATQRLPGGLPSLATLAQNPRQFVSRLREVNDLGQGFNAAVAALSVVSEVLLTVSLALGVVFFLLRDGDRLERWFRSQVAGEESVGYAYLIGVDSDLEAVYFGNVLTVGLVTLVSIVFYHIYVFLAPSALSLPVPTLLALLTGLATFIPLIVGKIVYVPVAAYLAITAARVRPGLLWIPAVFLVAAFLLLDIIPQTVLRPYISGRTLHTGLVMFAYILGATFFGWYGLFLGPLIAVLVVQFAKVIFPQLLHGHPITTRTSTGVSIGSEPDE